VITIHTVPHVEIEKPVRPAIQPLLQFGNTAQIFVVASRLFYNQSAFDGNNPAGNAADLNAIDPNKVPVPLGTQATFANISGYSRGINGVKFMVNALPNDGANLSPADFRVRHGRTNNINTWAAGPAPTVTVLPNAGPNGEDCVLLVFPNNSIQDTYGAFQMLATANTGLAQTHTAVFGNVRGDTGARFLGNPPFGRDAADFQAMAQPGVLFQPAPVGSNTDVNKSARTDAFDFQAVALAGINPNVIPAITPGFATVPAVDEAASFVPSFVPTFANPFVPTRCRVRRLRQRCRRRRKRPPGRAGNGPGRCLVPPISRRALAPVCLHTKSLQANRTLALGG
jgi:hypothetical protein